MQVYVSPDGVLPRWAWTDGLATGGQQEIALPLWWQSDDPRDRAASDVLASVGDYLSEMQRPISAGDTMAYGWTTLRFRVGQEGDALGPDVLVVQELADPFAPDDEDYVDGAATAIALMQAQEDAIRRNFVEGKVEIPHRADLLAICQRVPPVGLLWRYPLFATRLDHESPADSGWFFGCYDQGHDHDDWDEREQVSALDAVRAFPRLFPYLVMPLGTAVIFEEAQTVIFRPDDDEGYVDPGPLFERLGS